MRPSNKRNLLNKLRSLRINYIPLAFLIPFVGMLMVMLFGWYEPFGNDRSMLYSDMYHQYYPFFVNFRKNLLSGNSLLYNWDIGMGLDYLGLISYYLASPLNLLSVLVPESLALEYFSLLMPIKLGLASLFFAFFLNKIYQKNDVSIALFGGLYGLCAWAVGYQWNIMWLDTFALLPLVALGTVSVLKERKFVLYTLTLLLSILSNYYIGFFTCIFVLLLCIVYEICHFRGFKKLLTDIGLMVLFSTLAIGMTAILELPALSALQTTYSSVNQFPETFDLNMVDETLFQDYDQVYQAYKTAKKAGDHGAAFRYGWESFRIAFTSIWEGMRQVAGNMGGGAVPTFKEGLPNLYCGVGSVVLAFLFLFNSQVKIREKICSVLLLILLMVSCIVRQLDYIWHGFHFTNQIPYRFSFLFSFVLLYMAYRAYLLRESFKLWQILCAGALPMILFLSSDNCRDIVYLAYNLVFMILYLAALLFPVLQKKASASSTEKDLVYYNNVHTFSRQVSTIALCTVTAMELLFNVINFGVNFPYTAVSDYPRGEAHSDTIVRYMREREPEPFYRAEVTHRQTLNDGALNGYAGISTFTSSANVKVTEFMRNLGYSAQNDYNRYCFEEGSPVSNLFLGLKYMVERDGQLKNSPYFDVVQRSGDVYLLENNAYLPLGFLADNSLRSAYFKTTGDDFYFQNRLVKLASGIEGNVWTRMNGNLLEIDSYQATLTSPYYANYASYRTGKESGTVSFHFTANQSGLACINLTSACSGASFSVLVNGKFLYSETYSLPQMLSVCQVEPGDRITVCFSCNPNEQDTIYMSAAILNEALFRQAYQRLSESTLQLTTFQSTHVEGTISCNRDGLLYTSIPQNGNWHAYVDGKEVPIYLVGDAMIAVSVKQGTHTVTFRYENEAFSLGWKISLVCALVFAAITIPIYNSRRRVGKYERPRNQ